MLILIDVGLIDDLLLISVWVLLVVLVIVDRSVYAMLCGGVG